MGLIGRARGRLAHAAARARVRAGLRHVAGPRHLRLGPTEVALVVVGRNAAFHLPDLVAHHRALGAGWLIYLDNGSTDGSVELAAAIPDSVVATTPADFRRHEGLIRRAAVEAFATGGWRLVVDADEMFDYPGAARLPLPDLVARLEARGHGAMVAQMLDMVPPGPATGDLAASYRAARAACRGYSLDDITARDYGDEAIGFAWFLRQNRPSTPQVRVLFGGIRRTLFGEDCCLTKHPLFRPGPGVVPLPHPHVSTGLAVSDVTALIRHYKFSGDFVARERALLAEGRVAHGETALRVAALAADPGLRFDVPGLRQGPTPEGLLDAGFLVATEGGRRMLGL